MKKICFIFISALLLHTVLSAATLPTGFTEKRLAAGLDPTGLAIIPDGRILVTIKSGKVILIKNDIVQTTAFLTIPNVDNWNERGLLSLVLDPGFSTNNYIYVYYTYKNPNSNVSNNRVSRFTVNGDAANPASELVLINFNNLSSVGWHNGGGLVYGSDGKIYASSGENANGANAQSMTTLLGKVLRINPDGTIPTDNPFYATATGQNRAIYALGFRNPFKMKIQPGTGKIYLNDVGAGTWEEVNELKAGRNYGWPNIEGKITSQTPPNAYEDPLYAYNHSNGTCSITGGTFYNPPVQHFPVQYENKYFFLDYCAGWIRYIDPANNYALSNFATGVDRGLDLAVDGFGNMYYLARGGLGGGSDADNTSSTEGELWRVTYTGNGNISITVDPQDKLVATGKPVTFVVSASGTAPITYQWKRNGVDIDGATSQSYTIPATLLSDNGAKFSVVVSNNSSTKTSAEATLTVKNNTAPVAQITLPTNGTLYEAGTTISFSGTATDAEDGVLPSSAFTWKVDFHHDVHTHPALDPVSGIKQGTFLIPDEGEPSDTVWYRIYLTVADAFGTKTTVYTELQPKKVNITLNTEPAGLSLKLDGATVNTPYTFRAVTGLKRSIEAENIRTSDNSTFSFSKWSNNGNAFQTIVTPKTNATYTASYTLSKTDTTSVIADAYVRGGINAGNAYGSSDPTVLQTKSETTFDLTRQTFLRFDISKNTEILGAKLRLFGYRNSTENNNVNVGVFGVNNTSWNETTLTWNNKPLVDNALLSSVQVNNLLATGQYFYWDVSDYVKNAKQNGATAISFQLANTEVTSNYIQFNSKEAATNKPQLILTIPESPLDLSESDENEKLISIHPNPFSTGFTVHVEGQFDYVLSDIAGKQFKSGKASDQIYIENPLTAGSYIIQIKKGTHTSYHHIIKN